VVAPDARREASVYVRQAFEMSERWARRVTRTDRTSVRQQASQPDDEELRNGQKALANEHRCFGYRRLPVPL
jgi:putative transposase